MFAASKTATLITGGGTDPQFNYVTMLLHGDGTNGAQNNTFLDSSSNNFTITRSGNTTQGSFSPYGTLWSNYFDGTGDYLKYPDNQSNLALGTGDFTIECWVYSQQTSNNYGRVFWFQYNSSNSGSGLAVEAYNDSGTMYTLNYGGGQISGSSYTSPTKWVHLAVTRASGTLRFFVNGTLINSVSDSSNYTSNTGPIVGGAYYNGSIGNELYYGYISNFRMVKGTALYTSAFTPSTTPLTAISGTQMLTCQSNRFIDNSSNAYSITVNDSPSVQRFNPFSPSAAYSTATIGGSGYFDGSGDYLKSPSSSAFGFDTGDFTMEAWCYPTQVGGIQGVVTTRVDSGGGNYQVFFGINSGSLLYYGGSGLSFSGGTIYPNSWNHMACSRQSGTVRVFLNGVVVASGTDSSSKTTTYGYVGAGGGDNAQLLSNGYVTDARIVKGTAIYTSNFTPNTTPLSSVSGTSFLLNMTNGAIFDNAMMNDLETVGNAQISTSVKKYGTGSIYFDGDGDYLQIPDSPNWNFGSNNYTIEFWVYPQSTTPYFYPLAKCDNGTSTLSFLALISTANQSLTYIVSNNGTTSSTQSVGTSTGVIPNNTWTHVAIVCNGSTTTIYVNGTASGSNTLPTIPKTTLPLFVGGRPDANFYGTGYIDDLRVTKGYARYTANFTPPTAAFPNN